MLDYTRLALQKTYEDFKKIGHVFNVFTQLLYIAYLTYSIIVQTGRWWIKTIFLTISVAYFIFYIVVYYSKKQKLGKVGKKVFKRSKLVLKFFELGVAFYSIAVTANDVTTASVILLAMMLVFWLLQVVFDVIVSILENRANLIFEGLKADWEEIKRPFDSVSNFVKKIKGQEIEPEPEKNKQRLWLDKRVSATRKEKRESKRLEKEALKAEKRAQKEEEKAQKLQKRLASKRTRKHKPTQKSAVSRDVPENPYQEILEITQRIETEDEPVKKRKRRQK